MRLSLDLLALAAPALAALAVAAIVAATCPTAASMPDMVAAFMVATPMALLVGRFMSRTYVSTPITLSSAGKLTMP